MKCVGSESDKVLYIHLKLKLLARAAATDFPGLFLLLF